LESLAKFNAVVDEIAMVINYAMHWIQWHTDWSNHQIHPYAKAAWSVLSFVSKVCLSGTSFQW
jgi:hypothetical protein